MSLPIPSSVTVARALLGLAVLTGAARWSVAASPTFPYAATVRADAVEVRSGPGQRYYVTGTLTQHQEVTVRRHDPGGWYMIDPPAGSFSWMESDLIRDNGDGTGMVRLPRQPDGRAPRALARIGSQLSDDHTFFGRELADGDTVQILGERTINTANGALHMVQIAPPPLEYRWVKGDYIVPVDETVRQQVDADPYAVPSTAMVADDEPDDAALESVQSFGSPIQTVGHLEETPDPFAVPAPVAATTSPALPIESLNRPRVGTTERAELTSLDAWFLQLGQLPVEQWNLDQLIAGYQTLAQQGSPGVAVQANQRLRALAARQRVWTEYHEFTALTGQTTARDSQLVAMQQQLHNPAMAQEPTMAILTPEEHFANLAASASGASAATSSIDASILTGGPVSPTPPAVGPVDPTQLVGAGIIQKLPSSNGATSFVLTAPDGRVLATLHDAAGVDLESRIGQSVGIHGERGFDPQLGGDVISIQQLVPVQLTP